jgi:hypothetical protein
MEVLWGSPPGNFQSSLRDFSFFEFLPRTASWAKLGRPCGTYFPAINNCSGWMKRALTRIQQPTLPSVLTHTL